MGMAVVIALIGLVVGCILGWHANRVSAAHPDIKTTPTDFGLSKSPHGQRAHRARAHLGRVLHRGSNTALLLTATLSVAQNTR
jgi:hypothetical protein